MAVQADVRLEQAQGLINKYFLPKVALTLISLAAMAGTYITMTTHGATATEALLRWLHLSSLAALTGGTMWWGFLTSSPSSALVEFHAQQVKRFVHIGYGAVVLLVATSPIVIRLGHWSVARNQAGLFWISSVLLAAAAASAWSLFVRAGMIGPAGPQGRAVVGRGHVRVVFAVLAAAVATTAMLDARLTFAHDIWAPTIRAIHLLAYSLWLGGAVWNIFVAGPAAKAALTFDVVVAAAEQLERFRWIVRFALPILFVTGIFQALIYTGWHAGTVSILLTTPFGRLVTAKLGLIAALVGVFITCPLWRACSPIKGICELEDLDTAPAAAAADLAARRTAGKAQPMPVQPSLRLDNRGTGCAGFVTIQKELELLPATGVLELLSSDPISWWELPLWLEVNGYNLLEQERRGWWPRRYFRFLIAHLDPDM